MKVRHFDNDRAEAAVALMLMTLVVVLISMTGIGLSLAAQSSQSSSSGALDQLVTHAVAQHFSELTSGISRPYIYAGSSPATASVDNQLTSYGQQILVLYPVGPGTTVSCFARSVGMPSSIEVPGGNAAVVNNTDQVTCDMTYVLPPSTYVSFFPLTPSHAVASEVVATR